MGDHATRRDFLRGLTLSAAGALGVPGRAAAEPSPETATLRLDQRPGLCISPQYFAKEFLPSEGFTDLRYIRTDGAVTAFKALAAGELDVSLAFVGPAIMRIDAGDPLVLLAGVHVGCFELFGTERIRTISDLKGKAVAVPELGSPQHVFLSSMAAHVGLDPRRDITWVIRSREEAVQLLVEGKVDGFLGFPPSPRS